MVPRPALTVEAYLDGLSPERRVVVGAVRERVNARLPKGFDEGVGFGMIVWAVPLSRYPNTYNGQPLQICALASQKQYVSLYLVGPYASPDGRASFEAAYAKTGKKLDMGKSCLRFSSLDEVAWDVVGDTLAKLDVDAFIAVYEASRANTKGGQKAAPKKVAPKKVAPKKVAPKKVAPKKVAPKKVAKAK